jgi:hypothetical protein
MTVINTFGRMWKEVDRTYPSIYMTIIRKMSKNLRIAGLRPLRIKLRTS